MTAVFLRYSWPNWNDDVCYTDGGGEYLRNSDWLTYQSYTTREREKFAYIHAQPIQHDIWRPSLDLWDAIILQHRSHIYTHGLLCWCVYNLDTFSDVKNVSSVFVGWGGPGVQQKWICILNEARSSNVNTSAQERRRIKEIPAVNPIPSANGRWHPLYIDFFFFLWPTQIYRRDL
jgi:hypothetical protein